MNITIQTVNLKSTEHLDQFINEKVGKLFHLHPEIIRIDVSLKLGVRTNPTNKVCSLYVSHSGENKFVKKNAASFEESILLATESMEKILRRLKKR
jgi:putative sigma-54 modulation protein